MIEILKAGTLTTIQDSGRTGYQELGVPETGAMDKFSFRCANLLIGNHENAPAMEAVLFGPEVKFSDDSFHVLSLLQLPNLKIENLELNFPDLSKFLYNGHSL